MPTPGLVIGPQDPDSSSDLVKNAGVHNKADALLKRHRANWPPALTLALSRPLDELRSEALRENMDEVEEALSRLAGRRAFFKSDEDELVDASVRGQTEKDRIVSIVYRLPSGRLSQGVIPYAGMDATEAEYAILKNRFDRMERGLPALEPDQEAAAPVTSVEADEELLKRAEEAERKAADATKEKADADAQMQEMLSRLERLENPEPWEGYDAATAADVVKKIKEGGVDEFGRAGLERIETYEANRDKPHATVLTAIEDVLKSTPAPAE